MDLQMRTAHGGAVHEIEPGRWRLSLPPGPASQYRWAQLDDYMPLSRRDFAWRPPVELRLCARVSHSDIPGTWGFGFWNDPFSAGWGIRGAGKRLPALPNAAWFFYASQHNYLSLRNDRPAHGFLAAIFRSMNIPAPLLAFGLPALPFMALRPTARLLRRLARLLVKDDALIPAVDVTAWHDYQLEVGLHRTRFSIDGHSVFEPSISPSGPLGLVIWIDNQYAALPPDGSVHFGTLPAAEETWLEIAAIHVQ
jgi:hypothetical protein